MGLGIVLLVQFILFDCLRLFFIFLTGTGMLTCVPPFLTTNIVVDLLKNYIKAFLATGLGLPFIKLCAEKTESNQVRPNLINQIYLLFKIFESCQLYDGPLIFL